MRPIVDFYLYGGKYPYSLNEIHNFTWEQLEDKHDYIQWLFPIDTPSYFNFQAPILQQEDIETLTNDVRFPTLLMESYCIFMRFLGVQPYNKTFVEAWVLTNQHNYLRITRMLTSLRLLGFREIAQDALDNLLALPEISQVPEETITYWKNAVSS